MEAPVALIDRQVSTGDLEPALHILHIVSGAIGVRISRIGGEADKGLA